MEKIDELKAEADSLGIKYNPNIGEEKLQAKIDDYYTSQETDIVKPIEVAAETKSTTKGRKSLQERIAEAREAAYKTKVVTVIDNDQRVNFQTNSFTVNCTNEHFDLGTFIGPLNIPVEMYQGHINVLKEVFIPLHTVDPKSGLSKVEQRPRYTISVSEA